MVLNCFTKLITTYPSVVSSFSCLSSLLQALGFASCSPSLPHSALLAQALLLAFVVAAVAAAVGVFAGSLGIV